MSPNRLPELQGIRHDHQDVLELSRKIRAGMGADVAPDRIQRYCRRFLKWHLRPHFEVEERALFPIIGMDHPLVRKAMAGHRRLQRLINGRGDPEVALSLIEEELEAQVRLEERELLACILDAATPGQLAEVMRAHAALPEHALHGHDVFWK
ncbi:MAG: hemerythrin domain-containing protein [Flavobacteriales bacterium]|nr:hemerythrin domain-containing protein [Flavobacteriales bacterium]MEB2340506.1 hemerythrin domain-containing protein [Flavobacteriia bacterium]